MKSFAQFLLKNSVTSASSLPLVHTTQAHYLRNIVDTNKLESAPCDVFLGESLTYFFVGRPAYRRKLPNSEAESYELPACFIMSYEAITSPARIFPFDSGGFSKGLYPSFINFMPRDDFEISEVPNATQRIIGAFFGTHTDYFKFKAKSPEAFEKEFEPTVFDSEIKALHRLARVAGGSIDDRRLTIEIQTNSGHTS